MAAMLWVMGLSLLMQGCLCSYGQTNRGCMIWTPKGDNVCCEACHPGHRLVRECGPSEKDLCTPCESGTFTEDPKNYRCTRCTQCVGAQVYVKQCTATMDTKCGCEEGLTCGDDRCSFCVPKCDKGQEPTEKRSCKTCPDGTFNDQIHHMCKPWSTKCPIPGQEIVAKGTTHSDIKCANVTLDTVRTPRKPEREWQLASSVDTSVVLMTLGGTIAITIIITVITAIIILVKKTYQKKNDGGKKPIPTPTQIIRTPTDDPRTLIAIECSFHEAQQEQGSSLESLTSKDSSDQLIA